MPFSSIIGNIDFSVKVREKGSAIESETNSKSLTVYSGLKRNAILIEQFTGQNCPNCPAGAAAIKNTRLRYVHKRSDSGTHSYNTWSYE